MISEPSLRIQLDNETLEQAKRVVQVVSSNGAGHRIHNNNNNINNRSRAKESSMKPSRPAPTPATRNVPASQGLIPDPPVNPAPLPGTGFRSAPGNQMRNQQSPSFRGGSRPPPPPSQPAPPNQPVIRPPGTQQTGFRLPPINQGQ